MTQRHERYGRQENGGFADLRTVVRRAFDEFLALPTAVILGFLALALATYMLDSLRPPVVAAGADFLSRHVFASSDATRNLLSTIASVVLTVASITFSVLFLAVQQSASMMTPQVYDQYMRRRSNQLFFGFFLGLGMYAIVTLATVTASFNPVIGGTVGVLLLAVALLLIPGVIYVTLNQIRPVEIIAAIEGHALGARRRQGALLTRTRRTARLVGPGIAMRSDRTGYVADINLDALAATLGALGGDAELELHVEVGDFVGLDDIVGTLRGAADPGAEGLARLAGALVIDRERNLALDAEYAVAQLEAIGWTAASSSKQMPVTPLMVAHHLRDLLVRWTREETDGRDAGEPSADGDEPVPVVYHDTLLRSATESLAAVGIAATEGMQPQTAAAVYDAFARVIDRLPPDVRPVAESSVLRLLTGLGDLVLTQRLERTLGSLVAVLERTGSTTTAMQVRAATDTLASGIGRLAARGGRERGD